MIIGLVVFGLAWVSFLMRYRLAQMMPVASEAATFPRARNLLGVLPPYNPLHGRTGDPTQIQAAVATYFKLHSPATRYIQPDEQGRTMLHWAAYGNTNEVELRSLLTQLPDLLNQIDVYGDTPLIIAIEHGNATAARVFSEAIRILDADRTNRFNCCALAYAAYFDEATTAATLTAITKQEFGLQAERLAVKRGYINTAAAIHANLPVVVVPPT